MNIILKIFFQEFKHIVFLRMLVGVVEDYTIHNARKNKFVLPYFKQLVIAYNIFLKKIICYILMKRIYKTKFLFIYKYA